MPRTTPGNQPRAVFEVPNQRPRFPMWPACRRHVEKPKYTDVSRHVNAMREKNVRSPRVGYLASGTTLAARRLPT